jgi:glycosyltransferase EpsD
MLINNGYQVDVIAARDDREVANAHHCYYWDLSRSPFNFRNISAYQQIKKLVEKEQYDLVHCHTATAAVIARLALRKARKNGTKVIYTAHGFHFYKGSP